MGLTPQEAVDIVIDCPTFGVRMKEDDTEFEVFADGWNVRIVIDHAGFARRWPEIMSYDTALGQGLVEWCELGYLECRRIQNEFHRRQEAQ